LSTPVKLPLMGQLHAIANILASWSTAHTEHIPVVAYSLASFPCP